ncbi:MAG: helix-turn-helix domain-containing protein, partial [Elusimicrobiota bacterium]|nr:helix-turn-helix domain-containing protein [Elusimicrobiota bacterium]
FYKEKRNICGAKIREIRLENKIKQHIFIAKLQAKGLDINPAAYSNLELGHRSIRDFEVFIIAEALGVEIKTLKDV